MLSQFNVTCRWSAAPWLQHQHSVHFKWLACGTQTHLLPSWPFPLNIFDIFIDWRPISYPPHPPATTWFSTHPLPQQPKLHCLLYHINSYPHPTAPRVSAWTHHIHPPVHLPPPHCKFQHSSPPPPIAHDFQPIRLGPLLRALLKLAVQEPLFGSEEVTV